MVKYKHTHTRPCYITVFQHRVIYKSEIREQFSVEKHNQIMQTMRRHLDNRHANGLIQGNFALVLRVSEHWSVIVLVQEGDVDVGRGAVGGGRLLSCLDL